MRIVYTPIVILAIFVLCQFWSCESAQRDGVAPLDNDPDEINTNDDNVIDDNDDNGFDDDDNDNNGNNDDDNNNNDDNNDDNDNDDDDQDTSTSTSSLDGCEGIDFLFIIDASGSMKDEQKNLIASFPEFIKKITDIMDVQAEDFHILVTDSDACYSNSQSNSSCGSPGCCVDMCKNEPASSCLKCAESASGPYKWCVEWQGGDSQCNPVLGAGHIGNNLNADCQIVGDNRYLTTEQSDLTEAFECTANVGTEGFGNEKSMEAMVNAVGSLSAAGECNDGFIRQEAPLVVVFITDEEEKANDQGSTGNPESWYQAVLDAKGGNERAVVVLGVFGDNDQPDAICEDPDENGNGAEAAPRLMEFLNYFPEDRRHFCSICLDNYAECFADAVGFIDMACDEIIIE